MATATIIERLCIHHDITRFDCPEEPYLEALLRYHLDANIGILPRTYVSVVDGVVSGYVAVCDEFINDERFFYIPHWAVSSPRRGSEDAALLIRRAVTVKRALQAAGKRYVGIAATPGDSAALIDILGALGFRRWDDTQFWLRLDPHLDGA